MATSHAPTNRSFRLVLIDPNQVLVDGGIRRGKDVLRALALGARGVMIGRPVLWGLAVGGEEGVSKVLDLLHNELKNALQLCGQVSVRSVQKNLIKSSL